MGLRFAMALALAAQASIAATDTPITLDLIVRDARNQPLDRLAAADVRVSEQGTAMTVTGLRRVQSPARTFAIFLDEFHVTPGEEAERARAALIDLVSTVLTDADSVVVLKPLDSHLTIQPVPGRREAALEALRTFTPRQDDFEPRSDFERRFIAGAPPQIAAARAQISASALSALVSELGAVDPDSRKTVVVVSDGFTRRGSDRASAGLASFESIARAANRTHVSIYPLSLTAPDAGADASDRERARAGLIALAEGTAGRVLTSSVTDLRSMVGEASDYYLVTLAAGATAGDDRFHDVSVSVAGRNLSVRSRSSYFSQSAAARARLAALMAPPEVRPLPTPRRISPLIRPWFGMSRQPNGQTQVEFAWEPSPPAPGLRSPAFPPASVTMSVTTPDGESLFEGRVAPATGTAAGGGVPTRASFASPPGRVVVQLAIEDAARRVLDRDVRDLVVNGFQSALVIGTPEVRRGRTARDLERLRGADAPVAVSRQFSRAESLLVRVSLSGATEPATLTARLVSAPGAVMRTFELSPVASRPGYFEVDLPLAWLAVGTYSLEFSATSGGARASERLVFRVTS